MIATTVDIQQVAVPADRVREKHHDPAALADSMAAHGLINPITVRSNLTLVSGYHRLAAAKLLGWTQIEARITDVDDVSAELMEIDENLARHDLTVWEQSKHIARREEIMREKGERATQRDNQWSATDTVSVATPKTTSDMAASAGMSERTWQRRAKTGTHITPAVAAVLNDIDTDSCSLPESTTQLNYLASVNNPDDQLEIATRVADGNARDVWAASKQMKKERKAERKTAVPEMPNTPWVLHECAVADLHAHVEPASVDWIITDPPYPREYLGAYSDLGAFATHALKPGGSLLCMTGQSYLPDVLARLTEHLAYHWTAAYLTPGGQAVQLWDRKVNTFWKPVLWFVNGRYEGDWIGDVAKSDPNDNDKDHHHWGQSESGMRDLLHRFTYPGQTICDPFLGGGTTAIVSTRMNRVFIGADLDPNALATTTHRLTSND